MKTKQMRLVLSSLVIGLTFVLPVVASASTYTVKAGDTLSQIAAAHHTSVEALAQLNRLFEVNHITVGQTITISLDEEDAATRSDQSALSPADAQAKEIIAQRESGGNYTAQNGQYYGRYQLTITYLNGDLSPENQERVADAYVLNRYGSWSGALAFWNANGWY